MYIKTHPKIDDNGKPWVEIEVSASGTDTDELESFVSHILEIIKTDVEKHNYA